MTSQEIRTKFLLFFQQRNHHVVPSSSLIPTDASVLLTTAGMQQFVPYLSGKKDPKQTFGTRRIADVQKCFRAVDINEVGDDTHHTFFEMLGNWSFGDYFKEHAIDLAWEFLVKEMQIDPKNLWMTIYKGDGQIPRDKESQQLWISKGISKDRILEFGMEDNFWGPTAQTGPCGPSSEIYFDRGKTVGCDRKACGPNCKLCDRFVEIWNLVFMEFHKDENGAYAPLPQKNVDTGMGFERFVPLIQGIQKDGAPLHSAYETDLFLPLLNELDKLCDTTLFNQKHSKENELQRVRSKRIIVDHIRGACFLIADGISPSKEGRGYILRRIIRRAIRHAKQLGIEESFDISLTSKIIEMYRDVYPELEKNKKVIRAVITEEREKFNATLERGLKIFDQIITRSRKQKIIPADDAFQLFDTFGFPFELIQELAQEQGFRVDAKGFEIKFKKHQLVSRAGAKKKFAGVGDYGEEVASHHSATHLLHQAVRDVLGDHAHQAGSDLTPERLRFDITHPHKITPDQIIKIEQIVNKKIQEDLPVRSEVMSPEEAKKQGAIGLFGHKYGKKITVWSIGDYSKEICGGPHVTHTGSIQGFKIIKEESSSSGIRRIKAVVGQEALKKLKNEHHT